MTEFFSLFLQQFHFLRPLWLLMLLPCITLVCLLWRQRQDHGSWSRVIAPALLPWLLEGEQQRQARWPLMLLLTGWVITSCALAGPAWQKQPVPISKQQQPWVVAVDLSYHMYAADLSPNRLTRMRFKLQDLFDQRSEGLSALVAYAGSAHTVAPLTDDSRTLNNLTKALDPEIMPVQGNNPVEAVRLAKQLLTQGSSESGDILLVTGSMTEAQVAQISSLLQNSGIRLSILGVGTEQGAPIPLPDGGYLKNQQGAIVVPQLEQPRLQSLARANDGRYQTMTIADTDLQALLPTGNLNQLFSEQITTDREFDQWHDAGYWLIWLLLPAALLGFRRGWLVLIMIALLPVTQDAMALSWDDLWQTRDQQGQKALQEGNPELAASLFADPAWKAEALFQNQQFDESASTLDIPNGPSADPITDYNRGNALAKASKLQEAIDAYDQALSQQPDMDDARFNRNLVDQLLKQQSQQNQGNNREQDNSQEQSDQGKDTQQASRGDNSQSSNNRDEASSDNEKAGENTREQEPSSLPPSRDNSSVDQSQQQGQKQAQPEPSEKEPSASPSQQSAQTEKHNADDEASETIASALHKEEHKEVHKEMDKQPLSPEQQAIESWLRTIPDDPGGLLRRKFLQQQRSSQQQNRKEEASW
ncbi:VWA domain-containing protein [Endozoicomonas sp. SCSIO W0465]|uniref:VWA domain-containing protein n=1 Tax=Endozoicomonas sp. SCSIO W0465 TaxID=2918516 RepID=UPI002075815F|nr:VWA domain-containing protein [Endozoicomonas sp. SCSIO W0465]USE34276.1 VWA domain-containing protein [Endozoicomonas sp. SCSIO W0465]